MKNSGFARRILSAACLLACQQAAFAADETLLKATKQIEGRQAQEAYALLAPLQHQRSGETEYDYLLGLSALESGKATEAIFAFERVLATRPDHAEARMGLARALHLAGEATASREEFETLKRQMPPDQANRVTEKYLRSIDQSATGTTVRGYVEASVGYDTNINAATSAREVLFQGFPQPLARDKRQRSDQFGALAAGVHIRHAISSAWALNATGNVGQRYNDSHDEFNLGYLDTSFGATHTRGDDQFTGAVQYQKINLHNHAFRHAYGMLGQWQRYIDDRRQVTVYGQLTRLNYDGVQELRDADRYVLGASYSQSFAAALSPALSMGLQFGEVDARRSNLIDEFGNEFTLDHFGYEFVSVRLGGQLSVSPQMKLLVTARHEHRNYDGLEPSYLLGRSDRQMDYSLALSYTPALFWTVRPEVSYTRNSSNLDFYDFSRKQYRLTVRRDFN